MCAGGWLDSRQLRAKQTAGLGQDQSLALPARPGVCISRSLPFPPFAEGGTRTPCTGTQEDAEGPGGPALNPAGYFLSYQDQSGFFAAFAMGRACQYHECASHLDSSVCLSRQPNNCSQSRGQGRIEQGDSARTPPAPGTVVSPGAGRDAFIQLRSGQKTQHSVKT